MDYNMCIESSKLTYSSHETLDLSFKSPNPGPLSLTTVLSTEHAASRLWLENIEWRNK